MSIERLSFQDFYLRLHEREAISKLSDSDIMLASYFSNLVVKVEQEIDVYWATCKLVFTKVTELQLLGAWCSLWRLVRSPLESSMLADLLELYPCSLSWMANPFLRRSGSGTMAIEERTEESDRKFSTDGQVEPGINPEFQ